ncbi:MAG: Rpn family recombination-promoting nuclease/putative transposase [Bacteroidota bacterium]
MSKAAQPYDLLYGEVFSRPAVVKKFIASFLPVELVKKLKLSTLRPEPTSYVPPELRRFYADLVYSCLYGDDAVELCLIKEHKSNRPNHPHFQLLDYIREKWRLDRKQKKKHTPILCILLYHGKEPWEYKPMSNSIKGMDKLLACYNPLFDFILVNLNDYSDEFILQLEAMFLVNALLLLKHSGDASYIRQNFERIFAFSEEYEKTDDGKKFVATLLVFIERTTDISANEIIQLSEQSPKIKRTVMKSFNVWDLARQEGKLEGKVEGKLEGIELGVNQKEFDLIRKWSAMGFTPEYIAELGDIPLQKVKEVIASLEAEKKNGSLN